MLFVLMLGVFLMLLTYGNKNRITMIDRCIAYDPARDKIIIKLPYKKSLLLPNELRKTHRPVRLNHTTYEFYDSYVLINKIRFNF